MQFICPSGFFGAEMWILALVKHLDPLQVNSRLAVTHESAGQNLELYRRFSSLGMQAHKIRMSGRFDLRGVFRLADLLKKARVDLIHTHGYKSDIIGLLAARIAGAKTVSTLHGFENASDLKLQAFIRMGGFALRFFERVSPLSEELESDVRRLGVNDRRIRLVVNGVDLSEIEVARNGSPSSHSAAGEKVIGYVGQIAHRKNIGDMIRTFDLFHRQHPNSRLLLIGDGPMRKELEQSARSLESSDKIEFLGYRIDRLKWIRQMDLFCMTSSLEGIPRCIMEAMAMGIPVAAFNIPGVDKLIKHEITGLLAPFGDIAGLKNCWERILFNGDLAGRLAKNGKEHVEANFTAKRMAEEYTQLYQEMLDLEQSVMPAIVDRGCYD